MRAASMALGAFCHAPKFFFEGNSMRKWVVGSASLVLLALAGNAWALPPEMRCRLGGAYIKVYGKNEAEQKEVCERQGGEFTRYVQQLSTKPAQGREIPKRPSIWR